MSDRSDRGLHSANTPIVLIEEVRRRLKKRTQTVSKSQRWPETVQMGLTEAHTQMSSHVRRSKLDLARELSTIAPAQLVELDRLRVPGRPYKRPRSS